MKKLLIAFLILGLVVSPVFAASARRMPLAYNTSTFGGVARDYTTLAAWEDDTDAINLPTVQLGEVLDCYPDSASYDQRVFLEGTGAKDANYFRVIRGAPGHEGEVIFNNTTGTDTYTTPTIRISEAYVGIYDLDLRNNSAIADNTIVVLPFPNTRVIGCFVGNSTNAGAGVCFGVFISTSSDPVIVADCYLDNLDGGGVVTFTGGAGAYVYNSVISDTGYALYNGGGTLTAKNVIARNVTTTTTGTVGQTTCLLTTGAGLVTFEADGYHLSASDTAALGQGTDLSADAVFPFDDDVDKEAWGATWNIGCDSLYVAPATTSGAQIYFFQ